MRCRSISNGFPFAVAIEQDLVALHCGHDGIDLEDVTPGIRGRRLCNNNCLAILVFR